MKQFGSIVWRLFVLAAVVATGASFARANLKQPFCDALPLMISEETGTNEDFRSILTATEQARRLQLDFLHECRHSPNLQRLLDCTWHVPIRSDAAMVLYFDLRDIVADCSNETEESWDNLLVEIPDHYVAQHFKYQAQTMSVTYDDNSDEDTTTITFRINALPETRYE